MAKRPQEISDDDEEDVKPQPSSSKKPKTSTSSNGKGKKVVRDDSDEEEEAEDVEMKEEEEERDEEEEDAAYEKREEANVMAEIDARGSAKEIGQIAQMGIITRVVLDNFMCHTFLEVDLGPQINFLTGKNGSGKSAVLTAITVALGAKASATGRGAGIKGFIQTGKDQALVTVHLKNQGPEAYRHDVYGDEIIVARAIHRTGAASTYKIKSSLGPKGKEKKTISSKRDELDRVLDHMNIQVDNPINVLSQDAARAFLSNSGPKEKYDFFLRGTSLAQLSEEYDLVKVNIDTIHTALRQKEVVLPEMKETVRAAEKKVLTVEAGAQLEQNLIMVEGEAAWRMVINKEKDFGEKEAIIADKQKKIRKTKTEMEKLSTQAEEVKANTHELERKQEELQNQLEPTRFEMQETAAKLKKMRVESKEMGSESKEMQQNIRVLEHEIAGYQKQIDAETARLAVDNSAEKEARQQQIETITHQMNKAEARFPMLQDEHAALQQQRLSFQNQLDEVEASRQAHEHHSGSVIARKHQLEGSRGGGPYAPYGNNIAAFVQEVSRRRWQGQTPIGPLGVGVKLKDPRYGEVVRSHLGSILSSFAVTKASDANTLRQMFREFGQKHQLRFNVDRGIPPIIIFNPDPTLDISSGDLSRHNYTTLLSVLEIPNIHVRNILVDRASAERTPIFETRQEASNAATKLGEGASTVSMQPLYKVSVKQGTVSSNFSTRWNKPNLFVADHEAEIQAVNIEIEGLRRIRDEMVQKRNNIMASEKQVLQSMSKLMRQIDGHSSEIRKHKSNIAALIDQNRDQDPPNIAAFHDMIAEKTEARDDLKNQLRDYDDNTLRLNENAAPLLNRASELKKKESADEKTLKVLEDKIVKFAQDLLQIQSDTKHFEAKLVVHERDMAQAEADKEVIGEEVDQWTNQVRLTHPNRIESTRSQQAIEGDISGLKKSIQQKRRDVGLSLGEATDALTKASEAYQKAKKDIGEMKGLHLSLVRALKLRGDKWHKFRRYIALRAKVLFAKNLAVRGFVGKLLFRHDLGLLNLRIQTDELASGATQSNEKNPNQLSGGEKSFSTVALLLSFWDAVGCPVRCLDEFDVFMDAVVRRQTLQMMMDTAKATDNTQFVLITPQDTSGVVTSGSIKIIQMADPKRHLKGAEAAAAADEE
ncbi:hypothetical protein BDY24DRAFT_374788 [Mrakia frigida]|uniref:uncharacterized protein n=1 Tax=Mrakia frigida TaxID=29902 RepID=UPI003FCC19D0